ncbi:MAG: Cof-type HAD-IIB family hydrolase [Tannerella sp.]|jgi:Cof subfamily protein (haloacid dehalogenase superfamily)|nr:Cof-type HAD-IIB family hydrolase [Tannerella sp.]
MIKAIFLDIDGTMVSFETHIMPDNTRAALCAARRRGVKVFVATGRHTSDINNLGDMEFDGYITLNGAYCMVGEEVVFKRSIPHEDIEAFVRYGEQVRSSPVPCFFVEADRVVANMDDEEIRRMSDLVKFVPRPVIPQRQLIDKEIFQLTAFFPHAEEASIMKHLPGCCSTRWYPTFTDIIARDVDKSVGLAKIGEYFGISVAEMMSFGDGGNDINMLRYAGTGVAMGNADDEVKHAADYITTSVDEDGIGHALRHFGII